jgi:hypothetical protein
MNNKFRNLTINDYCKLRYKLHNEYIINCIYCKLEYKLSTILQHLKNNKRCIKIQNEFKLNDNNKYIDDNINYINKISNMKKKIIEDHFNK